jgi:hypothetical protein
VRSNHVTDLEIERYREHRLPAGDLMVFSDHIAECDDCRRRLATAVDVRRLQGAAIREWEDEADHVPETDVQAYVDRTLVPSRQLEVARHLEVCAACAAEIRDLQAFAASDGGVRRARWPVYTGLAVAAGLLLAIAASYLVPWTGSTDHRIALSDLGGTIVLDARGRIDGLDGFSDEDRTTVSDTLRTGRIELPPTIAALKGQRGTLLGEPDTTTLRLIAPVATAVIEDRPTLRWTGISGAVSYQITLRDLSSGETTSSPSLPATEWQPAAPLARGRTYVWQVVANVGRAEIVAPRPPAPPVMFSVLDAATASSLGRLGTSHLARGILYARAGALDDAERELAALAAQNPDSALVRALLEDLRSRRSSP